MTSKTKIIVLHLKELIYTGIFVVLGIVFVILLITLFAPEKESKTVPQTSVPESTAEEDFTTPEDSQPTLSGNTYIPGVYTTALVLGEHTIDVEVVVDAAHINAIRLVQLDEVVTTMYPLLQPTFDSLTEQICATQSLEGITYQEENKYTSMVVLEAIQASLDKAMPQP